MKNKIYIGIGIILFLMAVVVKNKALTIGSFIFLLLSVLSVFAIRSGVEYSESHYYRVYRRIFFWKVGHWKSILGVRKIYIRHYYYDDKKAVLQTNMLLESTREDVLFQVYFVRKSGYYKIFESNSLEIARRKARELAWKYNLTIKERGDEKQEELLRQEQPQEELMLHA